MEAVRLLLQFTPDPQCSGDRVDLFAQDEEDGLSPLHEAVQAGEEEVVRLILQMAWRRRRQLATLLPIFPQSESC